MIPAASRLQQRMSSDEGMTLVETLVAIILMSVVGAVVLAATIASLRSVRLSDNETNGQTDVSFASNQLSRDIRDSRGVVCDGAASDPTCTAHLQLWIDSNANYKQDTGETVTWRLTASADGVHRDLVRTTDGGSSLTAARTIVSQVAFTYDTAPGPNQPAPGQATTRVVTVQMDYASGNDTTKKRIVTFQTNLRNVP